MIACSLIEVHDAITYDVTSYWIQAPVEVSCVFGIPVVCALVLGGLIPFLSHVSTN